MGKKYKSVLEMVKDISEDESFNQLVEKQIKVKKISKFLFYLRCNHNLSQKQLAKKIGCTQSRISKIESAFDKELTIQDLLDYAKALNLNLEIGYRHPSIRRVDLIKYHAFKIKEYFNQLNDLVKDDEKLKEGIGKFHVEAMHNLAAIISESLLNLKSKDKKREKDTIHISAPIEKEKLKNLLELKEIKEKRIKSL